MFCTWKKEWFSHFSSVLIPISLLLSTLQYPKGHDYRTSLHSTSICQQSQIEVLAGESRVTFILTYRGKVLSIHQACLIQRAEPKAFHQPDRKPRWRSTSHPSPRQSPWPSDWTSEGNIVLFPFSAKPWRLCLRPTEIWSVWSQSKSAASRADPQFIRHFSSRLRSCCSFSPIRAHSGIQSRRAPTHHRFSLPLQGAGEGRVEGHLEEVVQNSHRRERRGDLLIHLSPIASFLHACRSR